MVKRNAIATKLTKRCTQTQKQAFDVAVWYMVSKGLVCLYILEKVEIWSGDTDA